jgi:DNA-binding transcriptional LysR family regulator
MSALDLKLLGILIELHRTGSVSQTAENLGLTQPAVSMSLARLRKYFDDPLFVSTRRGMEPTPHASTIIAGVKQAHDLIRAAVEYRDTFDPTTSTRTFRIAATDIGQVVILPSLMNRLRTSAPLATVEFTNFSDRSHAQLQAGDLDVALGFIPPLESGFHCQKLFTERFVCVARKQHPRVKQRLTLEDFERESHLTVATSGTGHSVLEKTLESMNVRRKVGLRVPNFVGLAPLVASTDLLATVPERLARIIVELVPARIYELPIPVPDYSVMQYWHTRSDKEAAARWLRALIVELFQRS